MSNLKFNIGDNPEVSETIQKHLFKLGAMWRFFGGATIRNTEKPYLYLSNGFITHGNLESFFVADENKEVDIEWMKPTKRETVEIGGKRYYADDLADALSKIKEI